MIKKKKKEKPASAKALPDKKKLEEIEKRLEECQKLKDEYLAGWQRSRADFLNYKKEETERIEKIREFAENELILKILKIIDNLERAKKRIPEGLKDSDWLQGFFQIENQFKDFLEKEGIEEIKAIEEKFNPNFHEAVEEVEREDTETGKVVEVLEKGYKRGDTLLRPAKVKVAKQKGR